MIIYLIKSSIELRFFFSCSCQGNNLGHNPLLNVKKLAIVGHGHSLVAHQKVMALSLRICECLDFNPNISILYGRVCTFWPKSLGLWKLIILGVCNCQPFLSLSILLYLLKLAYWNNVRFAGWGFHIDQFLVGMQIFGVFDFLAEKGLTSLIVVIECVSIGDHCAKENIFRLLVNFLDLDFRLIENLLILVQRLFNNICVNPLLDLIILSFKVLLTVITENVLNGNQQTVNVILLSRNTWRNDWVLASGRREIYRHWREYCSWVMCIIENSEILFQLG